jgi:hypothetical protein
VSSADIDARAGTFLIHLFNASYAAKDFALESGAKARSDSNDYVLLPRSHFGSTSMRHEVGEKFVHLRIKIDMWKV